jgi:hypothetical protein
LARRVHAADGGTMCRPERHGVPAPSLWHRPQGLVEGDPGSSEHPARGGRCSCPEERDRASVHVRRLVGPTTQAFARSSVSVSGAAEVPTLFGARGVSMVGPIQRPLAFSTRSSLSGPAGRRSWLPPARRMHVSAARSSGVHSVAIRSIGARVAPGRLGRRLGARCPRSSPGFAANYPGKQRCGSCQL